MQGGSATAVPSAGSTQSPVLLVAEQNEAGFSYGECLPPNPGLPGTSLQAGVLAKCYQLKLDLANLAQSQVCYQSCS